MKKFSFFLLLFCLCAPVLFAGEILSGDMEQLRQEGMSALFNMDYDTARDRFQKMIDLQPDHPAGPTYLANTIWLGQLAKLRRLQTGVYNRGNSFFSDRQDQVDPKVQKEFKDTVQKAIDLAEKRLDKYKKDKVGLYYLGVAKNLAAGYEATVNRSFFSALRNGSKGVDVHRQLLQVDPAFIDAKLSLGMYHYIVGSLPMAVKILIFFGGVHGSKSEGLQELEEVEAKGNYARDEASVLLVMLYNREGKLSSALKMLEHLTATYPGNSLFQLELANTLGQMGKFRDAIAIFEIMLGNSVVMAYMPDLVHYQYGQTLFDSHSWERAAEQFSAAAAESKAPSGMVTMSHLKAGQSWDMLGKRDRATAEYKIVMNRPDYLDCHTQASGFLKKAYKE